MSKNILRACAAAGAVLLSAGTGYATNILTDRPAWGVGTAVVVLVLAGVALAVVISMLERRDGPPPQQGLEQPTLTPGGSSQTAQSSNGSAIVVGRDQHSGMPAAYVVLCLLIVAVVAVVALLVAVRLAPPPSVNAAPTNSPAPLPAVDLTYRLSVTRGAPRTVKVTAEASGEPVPGLTYWFVLEVNYGTGSIEYYPRQKLSGRSSSFDVAIPDGAEIKYQRTGRVYGLNQTDNAQAEDKFQRQGSTGVNDFFTQPVGQPISEALLLPY